MMPTGRTAHVIGVSASLAFTTLLGGCAVGGVGTILGRVTPVSGGWILKTYTLGAQARTDEDRPGIDFGVARQIYVFADSDVPAPAEGWYPFLVPRVPLDGAVVRYSENVGIDLRIAGAEPGFTLGFQRVLVSRPAVGKDGFLDLKFTPASPSATCINAHPEGRC